jgi:acetylornithine deacetylase/succinyl-diaminopimelate desuccinylase-like protein
MPDVLELACEMISLDTRSLVSIVALADTMVAYLPGREVETVDYLDDGGILKRNVVAHQPGSASSLAFAGHPDTVSAAGWQTNPFGPTMHGDRLVGLGATDMKGPVAALILAALACDTAVQPLLVLTSDEKTTKRASGKRSPGAASSPPGGPVASSLTNRRYSALCGGTAWMSISQSGRMAGRPNRRRERDGGNLL